MDQSKIFIAATQAANAMSDLSPLEQREVIKLLDQNKDDIKITAWDAAKLSFLFVSGIVALFCILILPGYFF